MLIDWTSSAKRSSVISSMIASMDSVWLTTAVQMICVEATSESGANASMQESRRWRGGYDWISTRVVTFCTPKATSTSFKPSDHFRPSLTTVALIFAYNAFKS